MSKKRTTIQVDPAYKNWLRELKHRINAKVKGKELSDRDLSKIMSNTMSVKKTEEELLKKIEKQTRVGFKIKLDGSLLK